MGVPPHAHHAIQITFVLDGQLALATATGPSSGPVAIVDADAEHQLTIDGAAALLFIDPESHAGRALRADHLQGQPSASINPEDIAGALSVLASAWREDRPRSELELLGRHLVDNLTGQSHVQPTDARVALLVEAIGNRLDGPLRLADAASLIHLSPSRLRHLFVEQTGLPFKSYVLWRRMAKAIEVIGEGSSLTDAAHAAGFADSAHLSRTCRRMFGLPASALEYL